MPNHIGQQFGSYRLHRLIGEGGFAQVYLGEHIHIGTQAAVKVLTTALTENEVEAFRNEARINMTMEHPNIVRVLDFGMQDQIPFLVMTYASRGSLRSQYPLGHRLPLAAIVPFIKQIASALQYIHDHKFIHRDVKPANMLVGQDGTVALSDFGIAVIAHSERSLSQQDTGGTALYMAPEQFHGKPQSASDQYALGVVVYEWLCGRPPFQGNSAQLAYQHCYASLPSLCERIALSHSVESVVSKALAKDPDQRFSCVRDFAIALERAISQEDENTFVHLPGFSASNNAPSTISGISKQPTILPSAWMVRTNSLQDAVAPSTLAGIPTASEQEASSSHHPLGPPSSLSQPSLQTSFLQQPLTLPEPVAFKHLSERVPISRSPARSRRVHPLRAPKKKGRFGALALVLILSVALALCGVAVVSAGYTFTNTLIRSTPPSGSIVVAEDFLSALKKQDYQQAFHDLGSSILLKYTMNNFTNYAQRVDRCYGPVMKYTEVPKSAKTQENDQSYIYTVTRSRDIQPYRLQLALSQDLRENQEWRIMNYGNELGPAPPTCL